MKLRPNIHIQSLADWSRIRDPTFFAASPHSGTVETRGSPSASFGHRIPAATGTIDDGVFAQWEWDGQRLRVVNDRYGFQPLFWAQLPGSAIAVSPSILTLIAQGASTDLDIGALAVFFRLGYFVGDDTPFRAVRAMPPNVHFEWSGGTLACKGRYPAPARASSISRGDAIDRYIDLFARSMAKRPPAPSPCALPISGGRDSRHILLELHRTGHQPTVCVSALDHPPDPNEDPEVGAALCRELGVQHVVIDQRLSQFDAQVRKNRETSLAASAHGWYLAVADFINGRYGCTYDGIAGDVLSQSKFLTTEFDNAFRSGDSTTICRTLFVRHAANFNSTRLLLSGPLKSALDDSLAEKRLSTEVERHLGRPNPVASFIFWNRTRREIALAPFALLHGVPCVYAPFIDHDLFDFLTTLPSSMLLDHRFHDDAIARAYPRYAHIPYARGTSPNADDRRTRARFAADTARALLFTRRWRLMKNMFPRAKLLASIVPLACSVPWVSSMMIYLHQLESIVYSRGETAPHHGGADRRPRHADCAGR